MVRRILLLPLLLLSAVAAVADTAGHAVSMWLAEGAGNRIYLLGSVHLLRSRDHPLPSVIDRAYEDAETLFMELDMDDLDPLTVQATVNRLGLLDEGTTLEDVLGAELYNEALRSAAALDIPLGMLDRTEPWYAAITVEQLALMRVGFDPTHGIEMYMTSKAARDGKPIHGLETVDEQIGFLDGLSLRAQRRLLMQTLAEGAQIQAIMDELIRAWRTGDIDYLQQNLLADVAEYTELYDTIVVDRNRRWADTIEGLLDDRDDYLIIVGALHLIGEDGVPQLLERRGVEVRQMHESTGQAIER